MLRATAVLIVLSIVSGAVAQTRPVQWISNPGDAVKLAKRTQKPLLFLCRAKTSVIWRISSRWFCASAGAS